MVKVISKMGISTIQSYRGAQIFEAIGLHPSVIEKYFTGTASRVGGIGLDVIAREVQMRHQHAFPDRQVNGHVLDAGGKYQWRADGEAASVQSADDPQAAAGLPQRGLQGFQGIFPGWSMTSPRRPAPCAACWN